MSSALVLLSGGMDSTTCLALAVQQFENVGAISIDYHQKHIKETKQAEKICNHFQVQQHVVDLGNMPYSMLTSKEIPVPDISYDEIEGVSPTYVPFRNGQMLSKIAAYAQAEEADAVFFGAHAEDAHNWAYPDCTPEFIGAMANAIYIGTYHKVRLITPLMWLNKSEVVTLGEKHNVPWELTWSCYKGNKQHCGTCPTCLSRQQAFIEARVEDPTRYVKKLGEIT